MWKVLATIGVILVLIIGLALWYASIVNGEVALRNRFEAQQNTIETAHDTMWRTVQTNFKINKSYEKTFKEGLQAVAEGRKGGSLFKSSTEASSQLGLTNENYIKLMNTVEGQVAGLKRHQDTLSDIWRQHTTFCQTVPNSFFVGGKVMPKPQMISSTATKNAVETKVDDRELIE